MANKYKEIKMLAEVLEEVDAFIENKMKEYTTEWGVVGEEQLKDWRTGELQWEDEEHTIPTMHNVYDTVPKQEFTDDDKEHIEVLKKIQKHLEKML